MLKPCTREEHSTQHNAIVFEAQKENPLSICAEGPKGDGSESLALCLLLMT